MTDVDGAVLAAGGVHVELGALEQLGELVPGEGQVEVVSDARVAGIYGMDVQLALGVRARAVHELAPGEQAKTVESLEALWHSLRLDRSGTLVALGGGCDRRGRLRRSQLLPRDRLGRGADDAGRPGRRRDRRQDGDRPPGREEHRRRLPLARSDRDRPGDARDAAGGGAANGRAEVVKTGLLMGEPIWELPLHEQVRRAASFKTALCLRDPWDRGERAQLNLGHTFAHALEAAAGFELPHGRAVALGLLAALRLSGVDTKAVEETLRPEPVKVDREAAWAALSRDKKNVGGAPASSSSKRPASRASASRFRRLTFVPRSMT